MGELVANFLEGKTISRVITQGHLAKFLDDKDNVLFQIANYQACMFDSDGNFFDWQKVEDVPVYIPSEEPAHDTGFDSDPKPVVEPVDEQTSDSPDDIVDSIDDVM